MELAGEGREVHLPISIMAAAANGDCYRGGNEASESWLKEEVEQDIEGGELSDPVPKASPLPIFLKFKGVEYTVGLVPSNPVRVAMRNVATQMNAQCGSHRHILKGVTGSVRPGEVLALMGPSGSGKTTLLKIVSGRLSDNVKGCVTYNDIPYSSALKRRIGFVAQDDILFPQLTVEETLIFAAFLRLPGNMSRQQKYRRVKSVIKELGLERCHDTRVGDAFVKGISGGERKRTSIGYEILVDPSLLLLDEPTSGLDSTSANKLLQIFQRLAKRGRTIVTTIHQPSSRMFYMFDKLLLIAEGSPIYHGNAQNSLQYFSSLGFVPQLAMNPAEFLLDLATGHIKDISIPEALQGSLESEEFTDDLIKFLQCKYKGEPEIVDQEDNKWPWAQVPQHLQLATQFEKDWSLTWLEQLMILSKRTFRERYRDYMDKLRLLQAVGVAILLGLLWWKSKTGTEAELRDQVGLLYYTCIFWASASIFGAVYVFPLEKAYLVKERKADMYSLSAYYACSTLCDMASQVFYPTVFMAMLYFMAGFKRIARCFFLTLSAVLLTVITGQGTGELLGAAILSVKRAGLAASLILMLFLLTGGYYVQHIPSFLRWIKYASPMYYGFRLMLKVQYSADDLYECQSSGGCRSLQSSPSFDTVTLKGGLEEVWILLAMAIIFRLLAYACLRQRINNYPC